MVIGEAVARLAVPFGRDRDNVLAMDPSKRMRLQARCIIVEAGVAIECAAHSGCLVYRGDEVAQRRAYVMASARWRAGDFGPLVTEKEAQDAIEWAIEGLPTICPACAALPPD